MFILDILKSDGVSAPSTNIPTPGGGGGSSAGPRPGHKYVKRTPKPGGGWLYEYAGEKHQQNHGPTGISSDEHTLDIPSSVSEQTHERAQGGSQAAMKDVYDQSRKQATDLPSTKGSHIGKHPGTGEPVRISVGSDAKSPTGYRVKIYLAKKDAQGNIVTGKDGSPEFESKQAYGAQDWDKLHQWSKRAKDVEEIKGPDGTTHFTIAPVSSAIDEETGQLKPAKDGLNYRIKVAKHAPEYSMAGKRGEIRLPDKEQAKARVEAIRAGYAKMQQNAGKQGASAHLQAGKTATEILEGGHLPVEAKATSTRVKNVFANDQEKDVFIQKLATEKGDLIKEWSEKKGHPIDGDLDNVTADKDSVMYRLLDTVARNYQHKEGHSVDSHILGNLGLMNKHGHYTRNAEGRRIHNPGVAGAAVSLDAPRPGADQAKPSVVEAAASGVKAAKHGGGSQAADDVEDSMMDMIDNSHEMFSNYKNLQMHKLDTLAAQHAGNKDINNIVHGLKARMRASTSMEDFIGESEKFLTNSGARDYAPHFLVHPSEVYDTEKSLKSSNPLIVDFCKSYTEFYAIASICMEEDLIKASLPPQDSYSHKDGSLYPRYYYKDSRGNQVRYTNAPDGTDDQSGQFAPSARHPGEPDMATNPEFFTPDGRKLTRAPYPQAPVEWNQSYHPEDSKNLWAARWVNPQSGAHEYSYVESDLINNSLLNVHRQNVIIDARMPVFRRYTAALFESPNIKDKVTGLMLSLLDQGRFRIRELAGLSVGSVINQGDQVQIGSRKIVPDNAVRNVLAVLTTGRMPQEPLFATPRVGADGGIDYSKMRRLGPHYIVNILEEIGVPLQALATYHASQTYSIEIQRILEQHNTSYNAAHAFAMLEVASEMGHNLDYVEDYEVALDILARTVVDPIVVNTIKQNVGKMGMGTGEDYLQRPVHQSVYTVFGNLSDLTPEEKLFSQWIHTAPIHDYIS